jgi:glycosyltransferase involved in cell wall biosynthesis
MFSPADISVVIPSYNSRKTIARCLDSLLSQDASPLEIILIDSSTDGTAHFVAQNYPSVRVHHLRYRTFPGPARNYGASIASGSIVAFIDADCIASPNWLSGMAECHSQGYLVVGGAIEVGNPKSRIAWAGHLGEFREFLPVGEGKHLLHVPTCNLSYRKWLFAKHGGFPNAYYPQEDLLFNYMLNRHGIKIWFEPSIRVRHFCREDLRGFLSHQHRIGRVTRCTLRRIDMQGSAVARRGWLAWLASPILTVIKFFRTSLIFSQSYREVAVRLPSLFFLLLLGSIWWGRGFASGARTGLSGVRGWTDPDEPIFARIMAIGVEDALPGSSDKASQVK